MRILSYLRELNIALGDWEKYQRFTIDLEILIEFIKKVKELQQEGS